MTFAGRLPAMLGGFALMGAFASVSVLAQGRAVAADPAAGCAAALAAKWPVPGGKIYRVDAVATGSSCTAANVTLTIRSPSGGALLTFASAAADLPLLFADVTTPAAMGVALRRWIEQPAGGRTTRDLPVWEADKDQPKSENDLRFQPEPLITRANYMDRRRWGQPLFCFLQGAESEACYALDSKTDMLILIGTRMLPG